MVTTTLPKVVGSRAAFAMQAKSPEILIVAGVVGLVASGVMACRSTLKVKDVMNDHRDKVEKINYCFMTTEVPAEEYTEKDKQKDLVTTYTQTGMAFAKLYGPPVALGVVSIYGIMSGHNILHQRNVALAAAYKLVDDSFRRYRRRVVDEYGADVDHRLYHDLRAETIIDQETDPETGKTKNVKKEILVPNDPNNIGPYSRVFDEYNRQWQNGPGDYNKVWLQQQQNWFTNYLQETGVLFLNEVLEALGFEKTQAGSLVGWVSGPNSQGDGFVSFGIFDGEYTWAKKAFINGDEKSILLDFNVDGPIWNLIR
jgi:hypothetical protein